MTRQHGRRLLSLAVPLAAALAIVAAAAGALSATAPTNTTEPTITGVAIVGRTLQGTNATWTGGPGLTFTYQWLRCNPAGGDDSSDGTCKAIDGATTKTYEIVSADIGTRIRFRVRASNKVATGQATSAATSVVTTEGGKPASSSAPTISGSPLVGSTLTGSTGTWVGDAPITYQYRWLRCDAEGNACNAIGGKTQATYKVVNADAGKTLRLRVIAKNARGQSDAFSTATEVVKDNGGGGSGSGGGGGGGVITLPNGEKSVDAKDVPKDQRLVVDQVQFSPNPVTSRNQTITVRIKVKDTRGNVVRNATVFIRSTPKVTSGGDNSPTATDGWVQYSLLPTDEFPIKTRYNVQFFVKAYRASDPTLGGIYGSRLVQVATKTP